MFLSHVNDIQKNQYIVLKQYENKKILINSNNFRIVSNICPHQKSLISVKDGYGSRVCPYHAWSFDINGTPINSGTTKCKNNKNLDTNSVYEWNNLLFSTKVSCIELDFLNLSNLTLMEKRIDFVQTNLSNVMDLFLDVDHIPFLHKGVYDKIGLSKINSVDWHFYEDGSLQLVKNEFDKKTKFYQTILEEDKNSKYNAAWFALYPSTMIEWQPGALFITITLTKNEVLVYKYRDIRYSFLNWKINESVWETAWLQDKKQAELISEINDENLEPSKRHFRNFLKKK